MIQTLHPNQTVVQNNPSLLNMTIDNREVTIIFAPQGEGDPIEAITSIILSGLSKG